MSDDGWFLVIAERPAESSGRFGTSSEHIFRWAWATDVVLVPAKSSTIRSCVDLGLGAVVGGFLLLYTTWWVTSTKEGRSARSPGVPTLVKGSSAGALVAKTETERGVASSLTLLSSSCSATGLDLGEGP